MKMGKHRSRLKILASILSVVNSSGIAKKTHIMYKAYLSYSLLVRYLNEIQGMDVDHINPKTKDTLEGEQPSNYQLICKYCHLFKSIDEGDFINKKHKHA